MRSVRIVWVGVLAAGALLVATSSASSAATTRCHTRDLSGTLHAGSPGAGQRYAVLVLRNRSQSTCSVAGYVGMRLLDAKGRGLPTNVVRDSAKPQRVSLRAGARASTLLHWTAIPSGSEPTSGACEPTPAKVEVTPPDETTHLLVPWRLGAVCGKGRIDILRLRAGTHGF
ncbi:MAG TPA: DUF4232 domain-containing protein [Solirubrobacteraceae bacterium]|jgi:hypothetical protein|nr:DUF4232 domain-containing protein [Solirubrobacteraceae bacterium]